MLKDKMLLATIEFRNLGLTAVIASCYQLEILALLLFGSVSFPFA